MKTGYSVYIADDHKLFRKAMVSLLQTFSRVTLVKDAENGKELLTLMKQEVPDVAIVDLQMEYIGFAGHGFRHGDGILSRATIHSLSFSSD